MFLKVQRENVSKTFINCENELVSDRIDGSAQVEHYYDHSYLRNFLIFDPNEQIFDPNEQIFDPNEQKDRRNGFDCTYYSTAVT